MSGSVGSVIDYCVQYNNVDDVGSEYFCGYCDLLYVLVIFIFDLVFDLIKFILYKIMGMIRCFMFEGCWMYFFYEVFYFGCQVSMGCCNILFDFIGSVFVFCF